MAETLAQRRRKAAPQPPEKLPTQAGAACTARVVDTNVLIVASAADEGSPFPADATPVEAAELRQRVLDWLIAFEQDPARQAVLDWDWHICGEYHHKLSEQDYGWLALMHKRDRNEVVWVGLEMDADGNALLPSALAATVADLADRKMVAALLAADGAEGRAKAVNACDTDWLDWTEALDAAGLQVEHLLHDWLQARWRLKHGK